MTFQLSLFPEEPECALKAVCLDPLEQKGWVLAQNKQNIKEEEQ